MLEDRKQSIIVMTEEG